ncbi:MAG: hypothetical protein ABJD11_14760 [Gemmatimonadota bacterium]
MNTILWVLATGTLVPLPAGPFMVTDTSRAVSIITAATATVATIAPARSSDTAACLYAAAADTGIADSADADTARATGGPLMATAFPRVEFALPVSDTGQSRRPKAFEYSKAYETRLTIHRWASYTTLPLFAAEYYLGQKLYNADTLSLQSMSGTRSAHSLVAAGVAGLFGINTITGVWNLWEARKDPNGRTRRYVHSALMILSDAGFVATGATAPHFRDDSLRTVDNSNFGSGKSTHRALAITSIATSLAGYVMMLVWK